MIEWIAYNYELTSHARERIKERYGSTKTLKQSILESCLAWFYEDDLVAIAINSDDIIYVKLSKGSDGKTNKAMIVTYTWKSKHGYSVVDKFCKNYLEKRKANKLDVLEEDSE